MNNEQQKNRQDESDGFSDDFVMEFDGELYSPSIQENKRIDTSQKIFDPSSFPYFGFFISLFMIVPVVYNLYRFRNWRLLAGSVLLFYIWVQMNFIVFIVLLENQMIDKDYINLSARASLILLGIIFAYSQKKMFRWFSMSGGEILNGLLFGAPIFAAIVFIPAILRFCVYPFIFVAVEVITYFR